MQSVPCPQHALFIYMNHLFYFFINSVDWNTLTKLLIHYLYTRCGWYDNMLLLLQEITSHYAFANALWGSCAYVEHCKLLKVFSASCRECEGNNLMNKILWSWLNIWFLQFGTALLVHSVICNMVASLSKDTFEVLGNCLQASCCISVIFLPTQGKHYDKYDVIYIFFYSEQISRCGLRLLPIFFSFFFLLRTNHIHI